jgi:GT2 family glycosyltransferase
MISSAGLTISVIIPVHNGGAKFRECLLKLAEAVPQPLEIIVVADGDTDGSWLLAKEMGVKALRTQTCAGPARARNLGARVAKGDILFFVDADVTIYPDSIEKVAIAFQQEPNLAALIGSYDNAPGAPNFLSQYKNLFHHYTHQKASEEASTFWGACGAIRREVFLAMGGFDEAYRYPSVEDIELGYRLKQAGHQIRLCKNLQVKHLKDWRAVSLLKAEFFYRALPWTQLILRDRTLTNDLNLSISNRISVILTYGLLISLLGTGLWLGSLAIAGLIAVSLFTLNAPVYRFFLEQRGKRFALQTIPWHWLYFLYSGLAFATGTAMHLFQQSRTLNLNLPVALKERFNNIRINLEVP